MPHSRRAPRALGLLLLVPVAALLIAGDSPETRKVTLRWKHEGSVAGFKIYTHMFGESYGEGLDVGLPPVVDDIYSYELEVSNMNATWVQVTASDAAGSESRPSNERILLLDE